MHFSQINKVQKLSFEKQIKKKKIKQNEMKTKIELKVEKLQNKNILFDGSAEKKKKASGEKFLSAAECQDKKKMMLRCSQRPHKGFIQTHLRLI